MAGTMALKISAVCLCRPHLPKKILMARGT